MTGSDGARERGVEVWRRWKEGGQGHGAKLRSINEVEIGGGEKRKNPRKRVSALSGVEG